MQVRERRCHLPTLYAHIVGAYWRDRVEAGLAEESQHCMGMLGSATGLLPVVSSRWGREKENAFTPLAIPYGLRPYAVGMWNPTSTVRTCHAWHYTPVALADSENLTVFTLSIYSSNIIKYNIKSREVRE